MALGATIHRLTLSISDIDRSYYADHTLRVARHPSETEERMMVRVLAFALHAGPTLSFGAGLSSEDDADLIDRSDEPNGSRCLRTAAVRRSGGAATRTTWHAPSASPSLRWRRRPPANWPRWRTGRCRSTSPSRRAVRGWMMAERRCRLAGTGCRARTRTDFVPRGRITRRCVVSDATRAIEI